jgi:hypothetical protein
MTPDSYIPPDSFIPLGDQAVEMGLLLLHVPRGEKTKSHRGRGGHGEIMNHGKS